jgi:hypothetical protein
VLVNSARSLSLIAILVLTGCGESSTPPKPAVGQSPPIRTACTTPEQAGLKASDITRKLIEAKTKGTITPDEYIAYNNTFSQSLRAWSETQNLQNYCAALNRIAQEAGLQ